MPAGAFRNKLAMPNFTGSFKTGAGSSGYSGLRGAPAGIGAYYQNLPYKQIAIGNYDAVGTTAASLQATSPSDQALLDLLQSQQPAGPYTPWAERVGDLEWQEVVPGSNRILFLVTQQQLDQVAASAGEPVTSLAVLSPVPSSVAQIEAAFDGTKYEWLRTEAVYSQADVNEPPKIIFLHWGTLRQIEDWKGRTGDELFLSRTLSGTLTFPLEEPTGDNDRDPPNETFEAALNQQFPASQVRTAMISPQEEIAESQSSGDGLVRLLLAAGVTAGAGYLIWKWLK